MSTRPSSGPTARRRVGMASTLVAGIVLAAAAAPASAVNIPEGGAVTPGSIFVIHFQVQEGCDGNPTDSLEVTIPEVIEHAVPEAVPGWEVVTELAIEEDEDAEARVARVTWTGGPLEEGEFLHFGLRARFPDDPGATIEFPVIQRCGTLERAWDGSDEEMPAPTVTLAPRLGPRALLELAEEVDALQAEVGELRSQLGDVDATNLRGRVSDAETAVGDLDDRADRLAERIDRLAQRIDELEQGSE